MEKLYSKITYRLIDEHLAPDPSQLTDIDHICDMNDTQSILYQILEQQKAGNYILVITNAINICNLILALNPTLNDHKIAVLCNDTLHADDAIAEIERLEKLLHTEAGTYYCPDQMVESGLFASDSGFLLHNCASEHAVNAKNCEKLYTSEGQMWGYVLPYTTSTFTGILQNHTNEMSLIDKCEVASDLLARFKERRLTGSVLLFKNTSGYVIEPVGTQMIPSTKELYILLYELFFDRTPQKDRILSMLEDKLTHTNYPNCIYEFFEMAFADKIYPGLTCGNISVEFLENTLHRMTWLITKEA